MALTPDDNLGYWLFYAQRCFAQAFASGLSEWCDRHHKPYHLTPPQWGVLSVLLRQDGLTVGTLSQFRKVEGPTVSGLIDRLEQQGLVKRVRLRDDRRVVTVYMTD